jgi:hypothetical protein
MFDRLTTFRTLEASRLSFSARAIIDKELAAVAGVLQSLGVAVRRTRPA